MEKLRSMTDFVLEQSEILHKEQKRNFNLGMLDFVINSIKYARLLKQPLELWMFVPCDEDGNILEVPDNHEFYMEQFKGEFNDYYSQSYEYEKAKERCLFEGFKFLEGNKKVFHVENKKGPVGIGFRNGYYKTVEDIICTETTLTPTALKQIGL